MTNQCALLVGTDNKQKLLKKNIENMEIQRFYDESLAHASYAVLTGKEIAIVDPARDPRPYYEFAKEHNAAIVVVIETHPHADFVSSHLVH
jgi:hydroxyacylglutathione hydrolase